MTPPDLTPETTPVAETFDSTTQGLTTDESLAEVANAEAGANLAATPPPGSYVKHAMRNMVRKRGTSLQHFAMTTVGLLAVMIGLAYLTR